MPRWVCPRVVILVVTRPESAEFRGRCLHMGSCGNADTCCEWGGKTHSRATLMMCPRTTTAAVARPAATCWPTKLSRVESGAIWESCPARSPTTSMAAAMRHHILSCEFISCQTQEGAV